MASFYRCLDALWEEQPPETAQKALQVHVSQLRKTLGRDVLLTRAPGYMLQLEQGCLDLERVREQAALLSAPVPYAPRPRLGRHG
jgi:DNA-binding SARP family transcriptional activator